MIFRLFRYFFVIQAALCSLLFAKDEHYPKKKEEVPVYNPPAYAEQDGRVPRPGPTKQRRFPHRYDERGLFETHEQLNQPYQEERSKNPQAQPPYAENERAQFYHPGWAPRPYSEADLGKSPKTMYRPPPWRPKRWWPSQGQYYIHQPYRGSTTPNADDRTLYLRITEMLQGYNIDISVNTGHVTLWGAVNSQEERQNIYNIVHSVNGVRNVNNLITVANVKAMPRYNHAYWRKNKLIYRKRRPNSKVRYPYHETNSFPDLKDPKRQQGWNHFHYSIGTYKRESQY